MTDFAALIPLVVANDVEFIIIGGAAGQDWADVERVIVRQTGKLDWDYIYEQLQPLAQLKDAPEIVDQLEARRVEFEH